MLWFKNGYTNCEVGLSVIFILEGEDGEWGDLFSPKRGFGLAQNSTSFVLEESRMQ